MSITPWVIDGLWVMDGGATTFHAIQVEDHEDQWLCEGAEFGWETKLNTAEMLKVLARALAYSDQFGVKVGSWFWIE